MHVMIDGEPTNEEIEKIYKSLSYLNSEYDIVVTSYNMKLDIYDTQKLMEIDRKLDIILEQIESISQLRNEIRKDIKYVFGIQSK